MDVVRKAHLSLPTVTNILTELMAAGYVIEAGNDKSRGGRPPTLFHFNPTARYAIGVEIQIPQISIGLVDLQGVVIDLAEYAFPDDATPAYIVQILQDGIAAILAKQAINEQLLIGIGLGVPGFCRSGHGDLASLYPNAPPTGCTSWWRHCRDRFAVPVFTQNESNVYALAELRYGNLPLQRDMILVNWSEGVKASVVVDGQILSGRYGNFGAIGHLIVVKNGRPCYCGSKGCLEMYASGYAFREAINMMSPTPTDLQPEQVFALAAGGESDEPTPGQ